MARQRMKDDEHFRNRLTTLADTLSVTRVLVVDFVVTCPNEKCDGKLEVLPTALENFKKHIAWCETISNNRMLAMQHIICRQGFYECI